MHTVILLVALAVFSLPALADTAQQERMKTCNADAAQKSLTGEARKKFMSECLSAAPAGPAEGKKELTSQQERMAACNAQAASEALKGEPRQKFMSECLSGKSAAEGAASQQDKMKSCNAQAGKQALKGDARKKFMSACLSK